MEFYSTGKLGKSKFGPHYYAVESDSEKAAAKLQWLVYMISLRNNACYGFRCSDNYHPFK